MHGTTLFVGVGSPHGDDRAGWLVADALSNIAESEIASRSMHFAAESRSAVEQRPRIAIRKVGVPADLLDWLDGVDRLIVCDAVCGGGPPGRLYRWLWPDSQIGQNPSRGSHDFGLYAVLELAAALGRLPAEVVVWGIEAGPVHSQARLSPEIEQAIPHLANRIWNC